MAQLFLRARRNMEATFSHTNSQKRLLLIFKLCLGLVVHVTIYLSPSYCVAKTLNRPFLKFHKPYSSLIFWYQDAKLSCVLVAPS